MTGAEHVATGWRRDESPVDEDVDVALAGDGSLSPAAQRDPRLRRQGDAPSP